MSRRVLGLWCFALGSGTASVLIVALSCLLFGKPMWWEVLVDGEGFTIYPPLSAIKPAFGNSFSFGKVEAGLAGAVLAGIVFVGAWLATLLLGRRDKSVVSVWFWLSGLCLLPAGVHLIGQMRFNHWLGMAENNFSGRTTAQWLSDIYIAGQSLDSLNQTVQDSSHKTATDTTNLLF